MKSEHSLTAYTKINSVDIRLDTIKLLDENIGRTLSDINHSEIVFDPLPRVMNKWDLIKSFCTAKETIKEMKTHRIEENICKQSDQKGINLKKYKQSIYLSYQKKKSGQKIQVDIFLKNTYSWSKGI